MKTHVIHQWLTRIFRQLIPNIGSVLVMAAMLFVYNAHAAGLNAGTSPSTISYQGTLSTASGTPVTGSVGITFRLYNAQSGGSILWTETRAAVPVTNGLFNILLGGITPIPSAMWDNPKVYLGVQVAGDPAELLPREEVSAVPYAMNASGTIVVPEGSITTTKIANNAVTSDKMALTSWSITDVANPQTWQTTLSGQYVEVPGINFIAAPTTNGAVLVNLSLTFSHTTGNTQLFCAIFVNTESASSARTTTLWNGGEENCATNFIYPVQAGQTYRFYAAVYAMNPGTLSVHKGVFTQLSGIYFGRP